MANNTAVADLTELVGRTRELALSLGPPVADPNKLNNLILQASMLQQLGALMVERANDLASTLIEDRDA